MLTKAKTSFISTVHWLQAVVGDKDWVFCHTTALECLGAFSGYLHDMSIDVYAKERCDIDNANFNIVDSFDHLEIVNEYNLRFTSFTQTVNDMLADFEQIDEVSLVEALNYYYFLHGKSFDGLLIEPGNRTVFDSIKDWAMEYYNVG
jgi:hypothetical protein